MARRPQAIQTTPILQRSRRPINSGMPRAIGNRLASGTKMVMVIPKEVLNTKILPQIPLGRLGAPEEIAGVIIYLCSDEAAFVTGANITTNGGQHMQ